MKPIIKVEGLSKEYRLGQRGAAYETIRESLAKMARAPIARLRRNGNKPDTVWALKDVSFEIAPGEVVGIIGRNGAGKSTLLKVLSRITEPSAGRVELYGRVGCLLEVGTGFHPELTGRENIYLNGAILGMKRREIEKEFDRIVDFSEVEKFIDTPVKRYSSGMYVRLAFAVAAHMNPEILVVDEVLAVGDTQFQKKCLGKMGDVARQGRTVFFVSHNLAAVSQLCTRGILLADGQVLTDGAIDETISSYALASVSRMLSEVTFPEQLDKPAYFTRLCMLNNKGEKVVRFGNDEPFTLEIEYEVRETLKQDHIWVALDRADGTRILKASADDERPLQTLTPGRYVAHVTFPAGLLNEGLYRYLVVIGKPRIVEHDSQLGEYFEIEDTSTQTGGGLNKRNGILRLALGWDERRIQS